MILKQNIKLEIKWSENIIKELRNSAKRYIDCGMWSAAMLELDDIVSAEENIKKYKKKMDDDSIGYIEHLENRILEYIADTKTYINDKKYYEAEEELKRIEKLMANRLKVNEMCETVPILERIRIGSAYMEAGNNTPRYVIMNRETKDELFEELKGKRKAPITLSVPGGRFKIYGLELIISENILVGHIEIRDDIDEL